MAAKDIQSLHEAFQLIVKDVEACSLLLLDGKGTILTWNKGVEKIKGYRSEEIIGQHISMFYLPRDRQQRLPERLLDDARSKGKALHVGRRLRKNGTIFWGSIEITAIKNEEGHVIGFTNLARELNDETDIGHFWFDNDGILHLRSGKKPHSPEKVREFREMLVSASPGEKFCCVADIREAIVTDEDRRYAVATVDKIYKAIAYVSEKPWDQNTLEAVRSVTNKLPVEVFDSREKAADWIRQFLKDSK